VTADDAPESKPDTTKNAETLNCLIRILRAGRMESAGAARDDMPERTMIERECPLIKTDEDENECLHTIKSESHPPSPKVSSGQSKSIKSKVGYERTPDNEQLTTEKRRVETIHSKVVIELITL
jgi:hypothetical protein